MPDEPLSRQDPEAEPPEHSDASAEVLEAAAAVIANDAAAVAQDATQAADVAAAAAWAAVTPDAAEVFEPARQAWLEEQLADDTADADRSDLARRSVLAATLAAEGLTSALNAESLATSDTMTEGIASIVAAKQSKGEQGVAVDQGTSPAEPSSPG